MVKVKINNQEFTDFINSSKPKYMFYDGCTRRVSYLTFSDYSQLESVFSYLFDTRIFIAVKKRDRELFESQYMTSINSGKLLFVR